VSVQPATTPRTEPDWDRLVTGVLMVALGVVWFLSTLEVFRPNWRILLPAALVAVGALSILLALAGRRVDVVGTGVLLVVLVVVASVAPSNLSWRVGEQEVRPDSLAELDDRYSHGIGEVTVDLRLLELERDVDLEVSNGVGEVVVRVPPQAAVEVDARVGVGEAVAGNHASTGFNHRLEERLEGEGPTLRLDLSVGIGQIRVER